MGHIVVTLACTCGKRLQAEGPAPSVVGVTTARLLEMARAAGWTRERGHGWRCPLCAGTATLEAS